MKKIFFLCFTILVCNRVIAQKDSTVYAKFTSLQNRINFYNNLVNKSITKNLSVTLDSLTEDKWQNAFSAIELVNFQSPLVDKKLLQAADSIANRSPDFQQSFIEMLYAVNRKIFIAQVKKLLPITQNVKVFAMGVNYLLLCDTSKNNLNQLIHLTKIKKWQVAAGKDATILAALKTQLSPLNTRDEFPDKKSLKNLFLKDYLKGNIVIYSLQRKNRNYPGLVILKDTAGNFLMDSTGKVFYRYQLARSLSNMPFYISNGNTPQGMYRLDGFGKSNSLFIGPTTNLQLTMPYETSIQHFLKDSTITDSVWSKELYARLLPDKLKKYESLYQSFYAGAAGRTEIIAHGTTVDPTYYVGKTYYPFTPTAGCLCTGEVWDSSGKRISSDQQVLSDAVKFAGGPNGYLIVIEIDDQQKPVAADEILFYLPQTK